MGGVKVELKILAEANRSEASVGRLRSLDALIARLIWKTERLSAARVTMVRGDC